MITAYDASMTNGNASREYRPHMQISRLNDDNFMKFKIWSSNVHKVTQKVKYYFRKKLFSNLSDVGEISLTGTRGAAGAQPVSKRLRLEAEMLLIVAPAAARS